MGWETRNTSSRSRSRSGRRHQLLQVHAMDTRMHIVIVSGICCDRDAHALPVQSLLRMLSVCRECSEHGCARLA
eukprot:1109772-Rhodomonas_salina.2